MSNCWFFNWNTVDFSLDKYKYVSFQLNEAGAKNDIIDEKSYPFLHSMTSGVPRKINQACYGALLECFKTKESIIDENIFKKINEKISYT